MAKVVLNRDWTEADGTEHKKGEEIDLSRETDEEKVSFDHVLSSGLVRRPGTKDPDAKAPSG